MNLIDIKDLCLDIEQGGITKRLLNRVSLHVARGEVVALVGESGSGKSLTARAALGLLPPRSETSGSIQVDGMQVLEASPQELRSMRRTQAAMVFQDPRSSINPVRTIGKHLIEPLMQEPNADRLALKARAIELLGSMGLSEPASRMKQYPHELSGGMLQRVMIAGALMSDPDLLICDESTTALDVTTQASVIQLLANAAQERSMGTLFITHDLALAASIADRVYVLKQGEVQETGEIRQVFEMPRSDYTKHLLAATPNPQSVFEKRSATPRVEHPDSVVRLEHVSKTYHLAGQGPVEALKSVSLSIPMGGGLAVVGESGSGKSTLGRIVAGLEEPDTGEMLIIGADAPAKNAKQRRLQMASQVQMVFQDPYQSLDSRVTPAMALARVLKLHYRLSKPELQARIRALLDSVGLEQEFANLHPRKLSGGQRQRVAIAKAMAVNPRLLILDEATSALDVSVQAQVLTLINQLRVEQGVSVLFISHDLTIVGEICDDIAVVRNGEIVERGPVEQVLTDPQHPYSQSLLAAVPRPRWEAERELAGSSVKEMRI